MVAISDVWVNLDAHVLGLLLEHAEHGRARCKPWAGSHEHIAAVVADQLVRTQCALDHGAGIQFTIENELVGSKASHESAGQRGRARLAHLRGRVT